MFVDTPAAYPGIESEERGVAEAIAVNLRDMMLLDTPIIVIVSGEGGSGGALGIAVGDRVLMQEFAIYSVIPPEGCAAILWRDAAKKVEAAEALKLTAPDLLKAGIIDEIVPEPIGGAHTDPARPRARCSIDGADRARWPSVSALDARDAARARGTRSSGSMGTARASDFVDEGVELTLIGRAPLGDASPCRRRAPCDARCARGRSASTPVVARLLCQRGLDDPETRAPLPEPVARSPARSDAARRHARGGRSHHGGDRATRSGSPSTATTTSTASPPR